MAYEISNKIVKEEYGLERFYKKRFKYYLFGSLAGAGLMGEAHFLSRNPYNYITGMVLLGTSALAYVKDYTRQISFKRGFVGRKIYTFEDGTKILADTKENALKTYEKHHHHKLNPKKFKLFHFGTHEK